MPSIVHILKSIWALSPDQRAQVRSLLDEMGSPMSEDAFANHMKALGMLTRKRSPRPVPDTASFEPAPTGGMPASDMIIEDRH
jgi:hypothetical protein